MRLHRPHLGAEAAGAGHAGRPEARGQRTGVGPRARGAEPWRQVYVPGGAVLPVCISTCA